MTEDKEDRPRVPAPEQGIEVNFCKNPICENFGIPARQFIPRSGLVPGSHQDRYQISAAGRNYPLLQCHGCGERPPLKSNLGVAEELARISAYLVTPESPSCPDQTCANAAISIDVPGAYQRFGTTHSGSKRYRCKLCLKTFAVGSNTTARKQLADVASVIDNLMNTKRGRRIRKYTDGKSLGGGGYYSRVDFFHRQANRFAASFERPLIEGRQLPTLYISVDRQEYGVNWIDKKNKKNIRIIAIGSADNISGYVFGMHANFDATVDPADVYGDPDLDAEYEKPEAFRKYARLWLARDFFAPHRKLAKRLRKSGQSLTDAVEEKYAELGERLDVEASDEPTSSLTLPRKGMQIHSEYTQYAHFMLLGRLLRGATKVRFFIEQESAMRSACLASFRERVSNRTCDAFYVKINKTLTQDEKRARVQASEAMLRKLGKIHPGLSRKDLRVMILKEEMQRVEPLGQWKDGWIQFPFPRMDEPEKAVCWLTNLGDYTDDHAARLLNKVSMHGIDQFFARIRYSQSMLARPFHTATKGAGVYNPTNPYNPQTVVRCLDIYRVVHNFIEKRDDGTTAAMRLGLADRPYTYDDIVYFEG